MTEQIIPIPADTKYFTPTKPFRLECGVEIPLTIAYHTYGTFTGDNALWVCHALTANSEVADWWPHTVEAGKFLDPERWFTVCANIIGSCYGTTGPNSIDPATGEPYYDHFPLVTVRDMARTHLLLADHLGIKQARAIIGSSIGGFQALEMALERPGFAHKLILIATAAKAQPWAIAADEAQRMALEADGTYGHHTPDAGRKGMEAARAIGLLTYRGSSAYNATQQEHDNPRISGLLLPTPSGGEIEQTVRFILLSAHHRSIRLSQCGAWARRSCQGPAKHRCKDSGHRHYIGHYPTGNRAGHLVA